MMIREWLTKHLTDNGLRPDDAAGVLDSIEAKAAAGDSHAKTIAEILGK